MSEIDLTVRFIGDTTGYRLTGAEAEYVRNGGRAGWLTAYVGVTDLRVEIDLAKAYVIEGLVKLEGANVA